MAKEEARGQGKEAIYEKLVRSHGFNGTQVMGLYIGPGGGEAKGRRESTREKLLRVLSGDLHSFRGAGQEQRTAMVS